MDDLRRSVDIEIVDVAPVPTAVVRGRVPIAELPAFFGRAYGLVFDALERQGVEPAGEPLAFYPSEPTDPVDVEAGVVVEREIEPVGDVVPSRLPGGAVAIAIHVGPYEALEHTYRDVLEQLTDAGLRMRRDGVWEVYLTDPDAEPDPARWRTRLVVPVERAARGAPTTGG